MTVLSSLRMIERKEGCWMHRWGHMSGNTDRRTGCKRQLGGEKKRTPLPLLGSPGCPTNAPGAPPGDRSRPAPCPSCQGISLRPPTRGVCREPPPTQSICTFDVQQPFVGLTCVSACECDGRGRFDERTGNSSEDVHAPLQLPTSMQKPLVPHHRRPLHPAEQAHGQPRRPILLDRQLPVVYARIVVAAAWEGHGPLTPYAGSWVPQACGRVGTFIDNARSGSIRKLFQSSHTACFRFRGLSLSLPTYVPWSAAIISFWKARMWGRPDSTPFWTLSRNLSPSIVAGAGRRPARKKLLSSYESRNRGAVLLSGSRPQTSFAIATAVSMSTCGFSAYTYVHVGGVEWSVASSCIM